MTEKRFNAYYQNSEIVSVHDKGKPINIEQMVECLNNLHEENQELRKGIDQLINDEKYWEKKAKQRVKELEEENQQLKETIRKMIVKEFTITKEDLDKEENTRITGLTNQILIEFCKSKGHTLEEITEFVEGLPNE